MNCPRCNSELPGSATVCPQCGAPVRQTSFSYLPGGAPPWPTNVVLPATYTSPTQGSTIVQAPPSSSPIVEKKAAPARKPGPNILAILALFLVSIVIGGGITLGLLYSNGQFTPGVSQAQKPVTLPTAAPTQGAGTPSGTATTDQLPTPTSFQTINVTTLGVSFKFPSDWQTVGPTPTATQDTEFSVRPQQQLGIELRLIRLSASNSAKQANAQSANQASLTAFSQFQGVVNLKPTTSTTKTIGGSTWVEQDATFSDSNSTAYNFVTITAQHNKLFYTVFYYSPQQYFGEAMQKYIQPILDSFKFLS